MTQFGDVVMVSTPYGIFTAWNDCMITQQLREFGGHQRNDLEMVLTFVREGDTVVDVGAHIGTWTIPLARAVGKSGHVYSYEGHKDNFDLLQQNIRNNGYANVATASLGVVSSEQQIWIPTSGHRYNTGNVSYIPTTNHQIPGRKTIGIDSWFEEHNINSVRVMKVDAEGSEASVLLSAQNIIEEHKPILYLEIGSGPSPGKIISGYDIVPKVKEWGYDIFGNTGLRHSTKGDFVLTRVPYENWERQIHWMWDILCIHSADERYPKEYENLSD